MSYLPNVDVERLKEPREARDDDLEHQEDRVHHGQLEQGGGALDELGVVLDEGINLHPKGSRRQAVHREASKQFLKSSTIRSRLTLSIVSPPCNPPPLCPPQSNQAALQDGRQ